MSKFKIKRGDKVKVIAGDDKGKTGEILSVDYKNNKVVVSGCNIKKKSVKPTEEDKNGGFKDVEARIHISNVAKVEE